MAVTPHKDAASGACLAMLSGRPSGIVHCGI